MKKVLAVLSLCGCLLPTLALADDIDDLADSLVKDAPLTCLEEASVLSAGQIRRAIPELLLEGVRGAAKLGDAWGPGNENYRQARDLVEMAFLDDEAKHGPIVDLSVHTILRAEIASWSPGQRAEYTEFFKQKGGRLYWGRVMDNMLCAGVIKSAQKFASGLPPSAQSERMQVMETGALELIKSLAPAVAALPDDQFAKFEKLAPALNASLSKSLLAVLGTAPDRGMKVFQEVGPELRKIVKAYKP